MGKDINNTQSIWDDIKKIDKIIFKIIGMIFIVIIIFFSSLSKAATKFSNRK